MIARARIYDAVARLFAYPGNGARAEVERAVALLHEEHGEAAAALQPLLSMMGGASLEEIQEHYTRTFDINPVCTLEVGWHIYGEDYARGAFLVKMRELLRQHNLHESRELPDHLTHVLAVLGRLHGREADDLAAHFVLPALEKMLAEMEQSETPYLAILAAAVQVVRDDHRVDAVAPRRRRSDPPGWGQPLPAFGGERRS